MTDYPVMPGFKRRASFFDDNNEVTIHYGWEKRIIRWDKRRAVTLRQVREWVDENTTDLWASNHHLFYFKSLKDANWFVLRWSL